MKLGLSKEQNEDFEMEQQIALDGEGNGVAIWTLYDSNNNLLKTAHLMKNEDQWSDRESLCSIQSTNSSLAMNNAGEGIAIWTHFIGQMTKSKKMQGSTYDITHWKDSIFNGEASQIAMNEQGMQSEYGKL